MNTIEQFYFTDSAGNYLGSDALLFEAPETIVIEYFDADWSDDIDNEIVKLSVDELINWLKNSGYGYLDRSYDLLDEVTDFIDGEDGTAFTRKAKVINYSALLEHLDNGVILEFLNDKL